MSKAILCRLFSVRSKQHPSDSEQNTLINGRRLFFPKNLTDFLFQKFPEEIQSKNVYFYCIINIHSAVKMFSPCYLDTTDQILIPTVMLSNHSAHTTWLGLARCRMTPNTQNDVLIEKRTYLGSKHSQYKHMELCSLKVLPNFNRHAHKLPQSGILDNLTNLLDICDTHL